MCRRSTKDPLIRYFLDRYGVNLLATPRERAACGEVYIKRDGRIAGPGRLGEILEGGLQLPDPETEIVAAVEGMTSNDVSVDVGLGFLEGFLAALGVVGVQRISAGYRHANAHTARFAFTGGTRDFLDPLGLGSALEDKRFKERQPWVHAENEYYVIGGVFRTSALSVEAHDKSSNGVELGAGVLEVLDAHAGVTASRNLEGRVTYEGEKLLAFGVQLFQVRMDEEDQRLQMLPQATALALKQGRPTAPPPPVFAGGEEDDAFIEVQPLSALEPVG